MTTRGKKTGKSERLSVLNNAEQEALYGLPDFDNALQLEFLTMDESELALACSRRGLHAQIYCILQIGEHEKPWGSSYAAIADNVPLL